MIHTRTKIIAFVSLTLALLSVSAYGGFFYIVDMHKTRLYDERLRAAEADVQARALKALEETVRTSADDRKKLSHFVLSDDSIIDFVTIIEETARVQGVKLTTNNLTEVPVDDTFEELEINATMEGSFDGVMRMLRILETIPEQSNLPSVSITKSGEGGLWTANITLRVTKYIGV